MDLSINEIRERYRNKASHAVVGQNVKKVRDQKAHFPRQ